MIKSHPLSKSESDLLANACRILPVHIHTETSTPWNKLAFESNGYALTQIGSFDISFFHNSSTKHYCPSCSLWSPHFELSVYLRKKRPSGNKEGQAGVGPSVPQLIQLSWQPHSNSLLCWLQTNVWPWLIKSDYWLEGSLSGSPTHLHLHTQWAGDPDLWAVLFLTRVLNAT